MDGSVARLGRWQRARGDSTIIVAPTLRPGLQRDTDAFGTPRIIAPAWSLPRLLQEMDVDICHAHGVFVPAHDVLLRRLAHPYVIAPRGSLQPHALRRSAGRKRLYRRLLGHRTIYGRAAAVIALARSEVDGIVRYAGHRRAPIVPNAIEPGPPLTPSERVRARSALGWDETHVGLVYVGRLDADHKGLDLIVGAFSTVRTERPELRLCLAGPDHAEAPFLGHPLLGTPGVTVLGPAYGAEKRAILAAADVFIQPARIDGLANGPLEAASLGIPLLVSEVTGLGDLVSAVPGSGTVIDPNLESVTRALRGVTSLSSPHTALRARVENAYAPTAMLDALDAVYRSACHLHAPR